MIVMETIRAQLCILHGIPRLLDKESKVVHKRALRSVRSPRARGTNRRQSTAVGGSRAGGVCQKVTGWHNIFIGKNNGLHLLEIMATLGA